MDEKPRQRRWYSFSLLSLFALVTLCGIGSWLYSPPRYPYPLSGNISAAEAYQVCNALFTDHPEAKGQEIVLVESYESGKASVTTSFSGELMNELDPGSDWKVPPSVKLKAIWQLKRTESSGLDYVGWHVESVEMSAWDDSGP